MSPDLPLESQPPYHHGVVFRFADTQQKALIYPGTMLPSVTDKIRLIFNSFSQVTSVTIQHISQETVTGK